MLSALLLLCPLRAGFRSAKGSTRTVSLGPHNSPVPSDCSRVTHEEIEVPITQYCFYRRPLMYQALCCNSTLHVVSNAVHVLSNPDGIRVSGHSTLILKVKKRRLAEVNYVTCL